MDKIKTFESFSESEETFTFSELPKSIQEEIIERERSSIAENGDDYWADPILEGFHEDMEALGLTDIEVSYTGFHSQGDGASFTARIYTSSNREFITEALGLKVLPEVADNIALSIKRSTHSYVHENTVSGYVEVDGDEEVEKDLGTGMIITIHVEESLEAIEDALTTWVRSRSKQLYNDLETAYDEQFKEEYIIDDLEANGVEFDESGNRI